MQGTCVMAYHVNRQLTWAVDGSDMFEIWQDEAGVIHLKGMLTADHSRKVEDLLAGITTSTVLEFENLRYISSSGLGILIKVQRRLDATGDKIRIINASDHIRELFTITRFDLIFDIAKPAG